jgi:hypothetical protein
MQGWNRAAAPAAAIVAVGCDTAPPGNIHRNHDGCMQSLNGAINAQPAAS